MGLRLSLIFRKITLKVVSRWSRARIDKKRKFLSAILCYHDISDRKWDWTVTPQEFEKQIKYLLKIGKIVGLSELLDSTKKQTPVFTITFDDGYKSVYDEALPILRKYGIKATVFVLGEGEQKDLLKNEKLLTKGQLKELHDEGWDVGYHSSSHLNLTKIPLNELKNELVVLKRKIEGRLSLKFKYFSYPFGKYDNGMVKYLKNEGFKAAFSIDGSEYQKGKNLYKIPRVTIDKKLSISDFKILLTIDGLKFNYLFTKLLDLKDKLIK